jgi:hypothetical protein
LTDSYNSETKMLILLGNLVPLTCERGILG